MSKQLTIKSTDDLAADFQVALALRRESMQEVLTRAIKLYINETKELQERGLIKIFGK